MSGGEHSSHISCVERQRQFRRERVLEAEAEISGCVTQAGIVVCRPRPPPVLLDVDEDEDVVAIIAVALEPLELLDFPFLQAASPAQCPFTPHD